jgi:biopolymer transport protein ExbB/TolQ
MQGINDSFGGVNGSKESTMAAVLEGLSQALVPAELGLFVALAALSCYKYLLAEVEAFDSEMETASLQLRNQLGRLRTK